MESKPTKERRVDIHDSKCPVSLIAYVSGVGQISEANAKVCVGSGFKLNVDEGLDSEYWLSCAHTLEVCDPHKKLKGHTLTMVRMLHIEDHSCHRLLPLA